MRISTSNIEIHASSDKVWDALTNPDLVKIWQYGSILTTTWEPGSQIRFSSEWEGQRFEQWGKIIEFEPNSTLRYSLFAPRPDLVDSPENYFVMTYRLTEKNGNTLLEITQEDPRPVVGPKTDSAEDEGKENPFLLMLKELVEKGQPVG